MRALLAVMPLAAVLFADWTLLRMFPPLRMCWAWRGRPACVRISGQNAKRVLFGAINLRSGRRVLLRRQQARQGDFQAFLREMRRHYRRRPLVMLLDRAGSHTAPGSLRLAAALGIWLVWLPKQCSELNAMDQLWKELKKQISANRQYAHIDQHAEQAEHWVLALSDRQALRKAGILSGRFWLRHL